MEVGTSIYLYFELLCPERREGNLNVLGKARVDLCASAVYLWTS